MSDIGLLHMHDRRARVTSIRVTVDGVHVTARCQACDDRQGWALVFRRLSDGRIEVFEEEIVRDVLCGVVEITGVTADARAGGGAERIQ